MAVLALREYDRIHCEAQSDFASRKVNPAQYAALERLAENYKQRWGKRIFQYGPRRSLVAQNFVGVLNFGQDQIEILPKIDCPDGRLRQNFVRMLAVALELDLLGGGASTMQHSQNSILEVFISLFCSALWKALRGGMLRQYVRRQDELATLKGRLLFSQHVQRNFVRPDRASCEFDEFTEDNPVNQVLRVALEILRRLARNTENQSRISELMFCFQDVSSMAPTKLNWHATAVDRRNARYKPLLAMARLIIDGHSPDVISGLHAGFALVFDMNELFETYIGAMARKALRASGATVHLQGPALHLARQSDNSPAFKLKPDIVIKRNKQTECIIDTKWKRLKPDQSNDGVSSADMYQMHAYSSRYDSPKVILLYPHHAALGVQNASRSEYWLTGADGKARQQRITVSTVDLTNLDAVQGQLECMIASPGTSATGLQQAARPSLA